MEFDINKLTLTYSILGQSHIRIWILSEMVSEQQQKAKLLLLIGQLLTNT